MTIYTDKDLRDILEHFLFRKKRYRDYRRKSKLKYERIFRICESEYFIDRSICSVVEPFSDESLYYLPAKDYGHSSSVKLERYRRQMEEAKEELIKALDE